MKGLVIHAVLALAGLSFAYQTWTRPAVVEDAPVDEPVVLQCKPEQLERIELELPTHSVALVPVGMGKARTYWLTSSPPAKKLKELADSALDAGVGAAASSESEMPLELKGVRRLDATAPVTFRGSAAVDALLAELLPLRALRDLGTLDTSRDAEFGFDKAATTFRLRCAGQSITLIVAGRTYGNNDSYVRDQKSGKTYLLRGKPFIDLQSAQFKLMQNELHAFALADVDEALIKVGDATRKLLQRDRTIPGQAQWVDAGKPDQRNEAFGNWFGRVAKMRVRKYMPRGAEPGAELSDPHGSPERVMEIEYKLEGKPKGRLEVVRITGERGERYYYGRSETSEVWATLFDTLVKEIETDLPLVVGAAASSSEPAAPVAPPK